MVYLPDIAKTQLKQLFINRMYRVILIIVSVLSYLTSVAQQRVLIQGVVKEKSTGEAIIDANVYVNSENARTTTDNFGHFILHLTDKESYQIVVSKVGYKADTLNINKQQLNLVIELITKPREMKDILIKSKLENKSGSSIVEIPINKVNTLPQLGGEVDVMKSYQLMPGIQSGAEGNSGLYIRGGSPDQNLILIDDVPVYNVSHLGGFLSILDVNAVNKVRIYKGGFPARFGGRLSSVVDVRMKEGNSNGIHYCYNLGVLSTKLFIEGNFNKKTKFMISARRFNLDIPMRIILKKQNSNQISGGYSFYDLYAKVTHELNEKNKACLCIMVVIMFFFVKIFQLNKIMKPITLKEIRNGEIH